MSRVKPIKPSEVGDVKVKQIPDAVIKAFNTLIVKDFDGVSSTVKQEDVVNLIVANMKKVEDETFEAKIFEERWLDVEPLYREQGWKVDYDKPGYNETYDAFWVFTKKRG